LPKMSHLLKSLTLPVIAAPMFLVSGPSLVIASCKQGIIGTFPALNPRTDQELDQWLTQIKAQVGDRPYGVNLIVHKTNKRLQANLDQIVKHKVPLVITSLGAVPDVVKAVHSYKGAVFHDVTNLTHARKAMQAGVDGLIAVCAGAGGHAGLVSPFAFVPQLREEGFKGVICLAGSIGDGRGIKAAQVLGADAAYMGTRFIATKESQAVLEYKQMIVDSKTGPSPSFLPITYTDKISGVNANFLLDSLLKNGLDPKKISRDDLGAEDFSQLHADGKTRGSAWKDIWSAGHGVLNIHDIPTVETLVKRLKREYDQA
ncbi:2-nitropropane dioxygenase, partial [Gorgonomyces haynaldii]